ncbi:MAG: hypothetical protein IJP11_08445 [Oscillospiraceae bacterium]|nr:hypothetical protein [Oscillospiraceae bacterium]
MKQYSKYIYYSELFGSVFGILIFDSDKVHFLKQGREAGEFEGKETEFKRKLQIENKNVRD